MIPKLIHFTHFWEPFPTWALKNINEFVAMNGDYDIRLWSFSPRSNVLKGVCHNDEKENMLMAVPREVVELAAIAPSRRYQSDLIRMYLLGVAGGIYLDVDTRPYKPFDDDLLKLDPFLCNNGTYPDNYFMGTSAELWPWDNIWGRCNVEKKDTFMWFGSCNVFDPSLYNVLPETYTIRNLYGAAEVNEMLEEEPLTSGSGVQYIKHYSIHRAQGDVDPELTSLENPSIQSLWRTKCKKIKSRAV
jgi:hypothetical protein